MHCVNPTENRSNVPKRTPSAHRAYSIWRRRNIGMLTTTKALGTDLGATLP